MAAGSFTFVLHSHIPYVRNAGSWPFGEDILHEAIAETYLPLLNALHDLKAEGIEPRLTIGLTPILVEQIGDRDVLDHFEVYLDEKASAARRDEERFEREGDETFAGLARFYADYYGGIHQSLRHRYDRDVVGGFRRLQDAGNLDIITSAATHAYLPLLERDSSIYGQLKTGVESYRRAFGRAPHGVWLPECAYRPAYWKEDGRPYYKPGIEELLAGFNLRYFFTDTHVLEGGRLVGIAVGDAVGPYGLVRRRFVQRPEPQPAPTERTTLRPYYVQSTQVAVFGRDAPTGLQVWSAAHGYPGDFGYREFHRRDPESGLQYWRVTDASGDLGRKEPWNPERAYGQVAAHADHFVGLVARRLQEYAADHPTPGVVVSAYDTELFGHWWFEGVHWLKEVLRRLARHPDVELATAFEYLDRHPPEEVVAMPESSWGAGGGHQTWLNEDTAWMWPLIYNAEVRMERLVERYPEPSPDLAPVLEQAARELLLLESSDWPFLISTGQAKEYAVGRFQHHLARFNQLTFIAERGRLMPEDRPFLLTVQTLDNPFPRLDYRGFRSREADSD